ncbi:S41 family peptidase [Rhizosphaericola mali]|uniref:PDZ domain-containing protein n=1 Tax=Rhizosphaericola mali TaxID=2545455 RepID=A0A5P2G1Q8_9BACT|nr:S41 family peptidase [Rhizosphaericola mali]QES89375.1 hypothetical protein E0W69_012110 [Rhizosphaericola mali]
MKILFHLCIGILFSLNILAQNNKHYVQIAQSAYSIYWLAEKYHVQPRAMDNHFSNDIWKSFLGTLDESKIFFTEEDIQKLREYQDVIDDEIRTKKYSFFEISSQLFVTRLKRADSIITNILKSPFNYKIKETFTVTEDTCYAKDDKLWIDKIRKTLKKYTLTHIVEQNSNPTQKQIDSLDVVYRKKAAKVYKHVIRNFLESPNGTIKELGDYYCQTIASCYDPHTNYMSLAEKEDLEEELGQKTMIFGFSLDNDENDIAIIDKLIPGSVAFKSGQINKGDKINRLQWENKNAVDVSDASAQEISELLNQDNHSKLTLFLKKQDGSERIVNLTRSENTEDDDNKVKSFILKGEKTIGYISLPAFYKDWEHEENIDGCANDVAKEIVKLKEANIDALILDVRFNGGGSVSEAAELAGIFIDAGPIGIMHVRNEKNTLLNDVNRGTVYDGPLLYMINGYSASASEIVAAALQDYNRALVVGSRSYGKATGQLIIPLDTTVNLEKYNELDSLKQEYLKITSMKLYRVDGSMAQFYGVAPDVVLPDLSSIYPQYEGDEPYALKPDRIAGNKYYKPFGYPLPKFQSYADSAMMKSNYFTELNKIISTEHKQSEFIDIP